MARPFRRLSFVSGLLAGRLLSAQQPMAPHPLGPTLAAAPNAFGAIQQVRELPDGRVLVNDFGRRMLVVVDSQLRSPVVVLDSAGGKDNSYGPGVSPLFAFRGDSLLFADSRSRSFLLLSPTLHVVRVMAAPPSALGTPRNGFERWTPAFGLVGTVLLKAGTLCAAAVSMQDECLAGVIATDVDTRRVDTIATTYDPQPGMAAEYGATADDWVVTSDGSLAILRTREYRIERVNPDGTRTVGPKVAHDWRRLDDDAKTRLADSLNAARRTPYEAAVALWVLDSADVANGRPFHPRLPATAARVAVPAGGGAAEPAAPAPTRVTATGISSNGVTEARPRAPAVVNPTSLPDYLPPVDRSVNQVIADRDNRVWVRVDAYAPMADGSALYDIVDRTGTLVDRVRIPAGHAVVGFGPGGIVYLSSKDGGVSTLEKVRVR